VRIATRGSDLALWQARHVASLLGGDHEIVLVDTVGDRRLGVPLYEMGGKGVFSKEVQVAVLDGRADIAVHSGKDLPSETVEGLALGAVPQRGDVRDALVGSTLAGLRPGAVVATGSVRRRAQLASLRPDLTFAGLRGNMATRVAKATSFDAIVVAAVAFERLGWSDRLTEILSPSELVPQVAQGALAVECRADDVAALSALAAIEHEPSRRAVDAERGFLAELGGSCDLPAGAYAVVADDGSFVLDAVLAGLDGHVVLRRRVDGGRGDVAGDVGAAAARWLLANGGAGLLDR
jgi:hydroxymethylbilane synthase